MKASELVKKLQELIEEHGDLPCWNEEKEIEFVESYSDDGFEWFCID